MDSQTTVQDDTQDVLLILLNSKSSEDLEVSQGLYIRIFPIQFSEVATSRMVLNYNNVYILLPEPFVEQQERRTVVFHQNFGSQCLYPALKALYMLNRKNRDFKSKQNRSRHVNIFQDKTQKRPNFECLFLL